MVRPHYKRESPEDPTKKTEILRAHQKVRQYTNNGTRRKKSKANVHKVDHETPGSPTSKCEQGLKEGNVQEWLPTATCGVSSLVNLRREDNTYR